MNNDDLTPTFANMDANMYTHNAINELKNETIYPLENKVDLLERAIVELKISLVSHSILLQSSVCLHFDTEKLNKIADIINIAQAYLRGRFKEEAITPDAYKDWILDIKNKLTKLNLFTDEQLDEFLGSEPYSWSDIMGFSIKE